MNTAIVTGAGRTIGAATAIRLAAAGYTIAAADKDLGMAQETVANLHGAGHIAVPVDVTDADSVNSAFRLADEKLGGLRVLVSCVGGPVTSGPSPEKLTSLCVADWDATYDLNARGTFLVVRAMLRLREQMPIDRGRIVTVASIGGQVAWSPTGAHYTSSKAAVIALTKFAAVEGARLGMTVNTVAPGAIDGPNFRSTLTSEQIDELVRLTPAGRLGSAQEVAAAVAWLVSDEAAYVTGATIDVNGGRRMA